MALAPYVRYYSLILRKRPRRYRALFRNIHAHRCRSILEIGVYNGVHARHMIRTASMHHPVEEIDYFGFDLFEDFRAPLLEKEGSKFPLPQDAIRRRLETTGARIHLFKGDTKETLPRHLEEIGTPDFVFVDGGHSVDTIRSDWNCVEQAMGAHTVVLFDDYYPTQPPGTEHLGCQRIIAELDPDVYDVDILEPVDSFEKEAGTLEIAMVKVTRRR